MAVQEPAQAILILHSEVKAVVPLLEAHSVHLEHLEHLECSR